MAFVTNMFLRGFAILSAIAGSVLVRDCGGPYDTASITSIDFAPTNVAPGVATQLSVGYNLSVPITGGTATYTAVFNGIPLSPTVDDLCTQTVCPKAAGSNMEVSKSTFPDVSGKILSTIEWADQENRTVWCVQLTFKV